MTWALKSFDDNDSRFTYGIVVNWLIVIELMKIEMFESSSSHNANLKTESNAVGHKPKDEAYDKLEDVLWEDLHNFVCGVLQDEQQQNISQKVILKGTHWWVHFKRTSIPNGLRGTLKAAVHVLYTKL